MSPRRWSQIKRASKRSDIKKATRAETNHGWKWREKNEQIGLRRRGKKRRNSPSKFGHWIATQIRKRKRSANESQKWQNSKNAHLRRKSFTKTKR